MNTYIFEFKICIPKYLLKGSYFDDEGRKKKDEPPTLQTSK